MGSMSFIPATITINAGEQVVWKNTSTYYHNVVDDPGRAINRVDVELSVRRHCFWVSLAAARRDLLSHLRQTWNVSLRLHRARNQWDGGR